MQSLLVIRSSLLLGSGQSNQLIDRYVANWRTANPNGQVVERDLARQPIAHLDMARVAAFSTPADQRSAEQQALVAESDALIAELKAADDIVIGLPLYNFGVPSTLKAWIDQVARAGVSFRYTAQGPEGLIKGKRVYVITTRGGHYRDQPHDTQTPYVRNVLGFLGMTDLQFVHAEGLALGDDARRDSLQAAEAQIDALFDEVAA
ncbi:MAG: NAD(P)H-dependent oxidoreductase [Hydrogenophaga sp.]|uniref:FMN-dependent NADH-azoreductase n=1 Tax=Hydrogenophaga sp. TaxID=1904254 RepID=UPI001D73030A|nr:NAD(P)H-dependent oxidoreductase [Hydrogenophaga sp.]MBX3608734.1 NAD(P)H-dependent oxidoreductase [Hydrogenophaga sp.]